MGDEELILALTELPGPVYKLTATVRAAQKVEEPQEPGVGANMTHHGVTCDACDKAGKHPGHNMMRISSPEVIWPQRLFKRIHKMQEKAEQRSRCRQEKQEKKEEVAGNATATGTGVPPPPPPFFGRGRGMFRGCGRGGMGGMGGMGMGGMGAGRGGMGGRGGQWNWQWPGAAGAWAGPTFEAMMQGWMGEQPGQPGGTTPGAAGDHQEAHAQAQASASNAHASAHSAAQAAAQDAHNAAAQAAQAAEEAFAAAGMPEGSGEEYLQVWTPPP